MNLRKRVICGLVSAAMAITVVSGCSSAPANSGNDSAVNSSSQGSTADTDSKESGTGDNDSSAAPSGDKQEPPSNGDTLQWLCYYDLNTEDKDMVDKFADAGYKVEYISCGSSLQYFEKLNTLVMSGDSPDMVRYEWQSFPHGISKNLYMPLDDYIDLDSPTWSGIKDTVESFNYGGKHYYYPHSIEPGVVFIYDADAVEAAGLSDDPFDLYEKGEWDWDAWRSLMVEWCKQGDDYFGVAVTGFVALPVIATTGTVLIKVDGVNKEIHNNMKDANIQRCQDFLSGLAKDGLVYPDYLGPNEVLTDGKILFAEFALDWGWSSAKSASPDHNIMCVPIPKDPNADAYYYNTNTFGYIVPAGAKNVKAAITYMELCRNAAIDPELAENARDEATADTLYYPKCPECGERTEDKLVDKCPLCGADRRPNKNHYPMPEEIYDLREELCDASSDMFTFVFDDSFGFSSDLTDMLQMGDENGEGCILGGPFKTGESYTALRDSYFGTVESYLEPYRTVLKNFES